MGLLNWVVQNNAIGAGDFQELLSCIVKRKCNLHVIRVIPFLHEAADELPIINGPCIVYGSSGLLKIARNAGWSPAGWDGDCFGADILHTRLGHLTLNHAAIETNYSQAYEIACSKGWDRVFMRPVSEQKEFAGTVVGLNELNDWIHRLTEIDYFSQSGNSRIIVNEAKNVGREWRSFIVDGDVVSICQYADSGIPKHSSYVPSDVVAFLSMALQIFQPAPCFVVDVAEVWEAEERSLRIIEFNSINSAGFYDCNIDAIVERLSLFSTKAWNI